MTPLQIVTLAVAGVGAGMVNAIAGGGTILSFPALIVSGLDPIKANATSTVALIVGVVGSISGYRRHIPAVKTWLWYFGPLSVLGGFLGGVLLTRTPPRTFAGLVPFLLLFATILFMLHGVFRHLFEYEQQHPHPPRSWFSWVMLFQFAVAVYGGYFGAGIGILMLASLGLIGLQDIHQMNTIKTVLGGLINIVAAIYFIGVGLIDWPRALIVAGGSFAGYFFGSRFAQKIPQTHVRRIITAIGLMISAWLFYQKFGRG